MRKEVKLLALPVMLAVMLCSFVFAVGAKENMSLTVKNTASGVAVFVKDEGVLYKKTGNGKFRKYAKASVGKIVDKNVVSGEAYTYYVKSDKGKSEKKRIVFVSAPETVGYSVTQKGITLNWKSVEKADGYEIYRKAKGEKSSKLSFTELLSFTDVTAQTGKKYTYTVKAVKDGFKSGVKGDVKAVRLASPELSSLDKTAEGLLLKWKKVNAAQQYIIYRKKADGTEWKAVGKVDGKSLLFEDKTVTDGQKYRYYVQAVNGKSKSTNEGAYLEQICIKAPSGFGIRQEGKKVILIWDNEAKDRETEIFSKTEEGKWEKIACTSKRKSGYTHKLKKADQTVYYKIRFVTKQGEGAFSRSLKNIKVDPSKPMVALTYDDGPHENYTAEILDVLESYDARATFFVVGNRIASRKDILKRQNQLGCEIANHSYSHAVYYSGASESAILEEIKKTDKLIKKYSGQTPVLARAPGGSVGKAAAVAEKPFIQWSVDTLDWKNRSSAAVVSSIKKNVRDGSIVLMHDLYGSTAEATRIIVPWLIEQGYQLVTVSEMMQAKGIEPEAGRVYYNGYT